MGKTENGASACGGHWRSFFASCLKSDGLAAPDMDWVARRQFLDAHWCSPSRFSKVFRGPLHVGVQCVPRKRRDLMDPSGEPVDVTQSRQRTAICSVRDQRSIKGSCNPARFLTSAANVLVGSKCKRRSGDKVIEVAFFRCRI